MKRLTTSGSLAIIVLLTGCLSINFYDDAIEGSGVSATEERQLDEFDEVVISGVINAKVQIGESQSVSVTTDDNLLEIIETNVEDGRLVVDNRESISTQVGVIVEITVPNLTRVETAGASKMSIKGLEAEAFECELSGASRITASGSAGTLYVNSSGASNADLEELSSSDVTVDSSGASKISVFATDSLKANSSGASKVTYHGNPADVDRSTSGASRVSARN